jgi:hypothetical protein
MLAPDLLDMLRQWWKAARPQGWLQTLRRKIFHCWV